MQLFFREFGRGRPLIVLHGLFGMSDNWLTVGKKLGEHYHVFLLDLRNHGQSPHSDEFNYTVMAEDVEEFIQTHRLERPVVLGHSLGGKVGMELALNFETPVERLIVVDIAPRAYHHSHFKYFLETLLSLNLSEMKTRSEIDKRLSKKIPQPAIRQFLLKNLKRNEQNRFEWKINLKAVYQNLEYILGPVTSNNSFDEPVLFLRGEKSDYITEEDVSTIKRLFPLARIHTIKGATHWVHADAPQELIKEVCEFLSV
ncbi:alpha/beta fold hydrolase [Calditrichota bacterium LG25]